MTEFESTYQTIIEVEICGGYAVDCTLHHDGRRIEAIELYDGTLIECGLSSSEPYRNAPRDHQAMYRMIADEVIRIYGPNLMRLEFCPNRRAPPVTVMRPAW